MEQPCLRSQVSQVLTVAAGVCSGEEVNDQQAPELTAVTTDPSVPTLLTFPTVSQQFPTDGGAGWRNRGEEVRWCCERLHGGLACGMGANRKEMPE